MASAPAPENPETDRNAEKAALALLLLGARRRYDLPSLIRSQRIKPRRFAQIRPTQALASNIAAPHFAIVRAWAEALPDILAAVPFGRSAVAAAIEQAAARIGSTVAQAKALFPRIVDQFERWHAAQWTSRVRASTGIDVSMFTSSQDVADPIAATVQWNRALADDIHSQVKTKLAAALLVGGVAAADAKAKAADVIAKARKRAAGIGSDQSVKASAGMTHARMAAAGLTQWMWQHKTEVHYRPEHKARNGKVYTDDTAPDDLPGTLPFCRCAAIPLFQ